VVVGPKERQRIWVFWGVGNLDSNSPFWLSYGMTIDVNLHHALRLTFAQLRRDYPHAYPIPNSIAGRPAILTAYPTQHSATNIPEYRMLTKGLFRNNACAPDFIPLDLC
jgi:hypothetical protein